MVKTATYVVALLVALSGALWGLDSTYVRNTEFSFFKTSYYQDQVDQIQRRIWEYMDRLKKEPNNQDLKERVRELEQQKKRAEDKAK